MKLLILEVNSYTGDNEIGEGEVIRQKSPEFSHASISDKDKVDCWTPTHN